MTVSGKIWERGQMSQLKKHTGLCVCVCVLGVRNSKNAKKEIQCSQKYKECRAIIVNVFRKH